MNVDSIHCNSNFICRYVKMHTRDNFVSGVIIFILIPCMCFGQLQKGYSRVQYGSRLAGKTIDTYAEMSFLDCVEECLVTTRCKSVNYYKGANYCETNYEDKASAKSKFMTGRGWVYSERVGWPQNLAGPCASANCDINQKCRHNKYSEDVSFYCKLSDCGIPQRYGMEMDNIQQGDAIAINKGMHVRCSEGFEQFGSGRLVCRPSGEWDYKIVCVEKGWLKYMRNGHVYFLFTDRRNWTDAEAVCESREAYLVEIDSADESTWIKNNLFQDFPAFDLYPYVWIGGFKEVNETYFRWTTSNRPLDYTNWSEGNPNNVNNNENCLHVYKGMEWNDEYCGQALLFMCEINIIL